MLSIYYTHLISLAIVLGLGKFDIPSSSRSAPPSIKSSKSVMISRVRPCQNETYVKFVRCNTHVNATLSRGAPPLRRLYRLLVGEYPDCTFTHSRQGIAPEMCGKQQSKSGLDDGLAVSNSATSPSCTSKGKRVTSSMPRAQYNPRPNPHSPC